MIFAISCSVSALISWIFSRFFSAVRAGSVHTALIFPFALSSMCHRWFTNAGAMPARRQHGACRCELARRGPAGTGCGRADASPDCGGDWAAGACGELWRDRSIRALPSEWATTDTVNGNTSMAKTPIFDERMLSSPRFTFLRGKKRPANAYALHRSHPQDALSRALLPLVYLIHEAWSYSRS